MGTCSARARPGRPGAGLAAAAVTDEDVLRRAWQLVDAGPGPGRALWLVLLDRHGAQLPVLVPADGAPDRPDPLVAGDLCGAAAELLGDTDPAGSLVVALARAGPATPGPADEAWARAMRDAAREQGVRLRMLCLVTPAGACPLAGDAPAPG